MGAYRPPPVMPARQGKAAACASAQQRHARAAVMAKVDERVITKCGCITIPELLLPLVTTKTFGPPMAECFTHGLQEVIRRAKPGEIYNQALGLPLDFTPEPLPAEPPF